MKAHPLEKGTPMTFPTMLHRRPFLIGVIAFPVLLTTAYLGRLWYQTDTMPRWVTLAVLIAGCAFIAMTTNSRRNDHGWTAFYTAGVSLLTMSVFIGAWTWWSVVIMTGFSALNVTLLTAAVALLVGLTSEQNLRGRSTPPRPTHMVSNTTVGGSVTQISGVTGNVRTGPDQLSGRLTDRFGFDRSAGPGRAPTDSIHRIGIVPDPTNPTGWLFTVTYRTVTPPGTHTTFMPPDATAEDIISLIPDSNERKENT